MKNRINKSKAVVSPNAKSTQHGERPDELVPYTVWLPAHHAALMREIGKTLAGFEDVWGPDIFIHDVVDAAGKRKMVGD